MAWPTTIGFDETALDATTDYVHLIRPEVLALMGDVADMIGAAGIADGIATIGSDGYIPTAQLPIVPISKGGTGASDAATARYNLGLTPFDPGASTESLGPVDISHVSTLTLLTLESAADNTSPIVARVNRYRPAGADGDGIFALDVYASDDGGNPVRLSQIKTFLEDASAGTVDSSMLFSTRVNSVLTPLFELDVDTVRVLGKLAGGSSGAAGAPAANELLWGGAITASGKISATLTTEQMRLAYDASNYCAWTVSSGGDLTIAPSGGDTLITGAGSSTIKRTGGSSGYYDALIVANNAEGTAPQRAVGIELQANRVNWANGKGRLYVKNATSTNSADSYVGIGVQDSSSTVNEMVKVGSTEIDLNAATVITGNLRVTRTAVGLPTQEGYAGTTFRQVYPIGYRTTDATPVDITLATGLSDGDNYRFQIDIGYADTGAPPSNYGGLIRSYLAGKRSGSVAVIQTNEVLATKVGDATIEAALVATGGNLVLRLTGKAGTTLDFAGDVEVIKK